jgi:hypothetical protein
MLEELTAARPDYVTASRTSLRELMKLAASAGSLDDVYQSALHSVQVGLGIERASLFLFDADGVMRFVAWSGLSDEYRRAVDGLSPWSQGDTSAAPIMVSDVSADVSVAGCAPLLREEIRALAFIPLRSVKACSASSCSLPRAARLVEIATAEHIADSLRTRTSPDRRRARGTTGHRTRAARSRRGGSGTRHESENWSHVIAAGRMGAWNWDISTDSCAGPRSRANARRGARRIHGGARRV